MRFFRGRLIARRQAAAVRDAMPVAPEPVESAPIHPLDHDADGTKGGSLPAAARGVDELRAEAEALGVKTDGRWGAARLEREIAKAKA